MSLTQDLGLQCLLAEQALQLAHLLLQRPPTHLQDVPSTNSDT